eukprot:6183265-Pleurochrysis_carterae.AAC.1
MTVLVRTPRVLLYLHRPRLPNRHKSLQTHRRRPQMPPTIFTRPSDSALIRCVHAPRRHSSSVVRRANHAGAGTPDAPLQYRTPRRTRAHVNKPWLRITSVEALPNAPKSPTTLPTKADGRTSTFPKYPPAGRWSASFGCTNVSAVERSKPGSVCKAVR